MSSAERTPNIELRPAADQPQAPANRRVAANVVAIVLMLAGLGWLVFTVSRGEKSRLLFGKWHLRHVAFALAVWYVAVLVFLASKSRRALFALVFFTLLAVSTLGIIEFAGLIGVVSYPRLFGRERGDNWQHRLLPNVDMQGSTVPDLAYLLRYPADPVAFHYVTDRRGFRNAKDRSAADIYLVGDSVLVAGLLPFENTLTALLEKELGARTMNIALAGLGVQEERDLFKLAKLPFDQRLVLQFVFEGNDLPDSAQYRNPVRSSAGLVESTFTYNFLTWLMDRTDNHRTFPERQFAVIAGTKYLFLPTGLSFRGHEDEFKHICEALLDMQRTVTSAGGAYAIVYVPEKIRVLAPYCEFPAESSIQSDKITFNPLRAWLADWCRRENIALLDLTDALKSSAQSGKIPWLPDDTHPNAIGHRVAADALKSWDVVDSWMKSRRDASSQ